MGLPLPLPPGSTKRVANKGNRTKAEERDKGKGTVSGRAWPALLSSLISSPAEGLRQPRSLARLRGVGARGCFHSQAFPAPFRSSFIWVAQVWRHHRLLDRIVLVFSTRYGPIAAWPERSWKYLWLLPFPSLSLEPPVDAASWGGGGTSCFFLSPFLLSLLLRILWLPVFCRVFCRHLSVSLWPSCFVLIEVAVVEAGLGMEMEACRV